MLEPHVSMTFIKTHPKMAIILSTIEMNGYTEVFMGVPLCVTSKKAEVSHICMQYVPERYIYVGALN